MSIGSIINAFGTLATETSGAVSLDASAGRVRLENSTAAGTVDRARHGSCDDQTLTLLAGRSVAPFSFAGTGTANGGTGVDSNPEPVSGSAPPAICSLRMRSQGRRCKLAGLAIPFGSAPPDFTASGLLDPTTIEAEFAVNWGSGTADAVQYVHDRVDRFIDPQQQHRRSSRDSIRLAVDRLHDAAVGRADRAEFGDDAIVYAIGHASTSTIDSYNTFTDFINALQSDLNGTTLATGMTVQGIYTSASYTLTANSVTVYLNI